MTFEEQCQISTRETRVVLWLITSGHARATAEYLARRNVHIGEIAAWVHREFHQRFVATAAELGFDRVATNLQWWAVAKVAAVVGVRPDRLTRRTFDEGGKRLLDAVGELYPGQPSPPRNLNTRLYGAEATLYHAGVIDGPPRSRTRERSEVRAREWASVPPRLAETLQGYVEQMRVTLRPSSVPHVDEYFKVSEQVEALYDAPKELPVAAEGKEMRKLRAEMHRRMLGNGYCARPVGLDCHFESICESCTYFQTTLEFRPTLQRQRDDAATNGQVARLKIFDGLPERLDAQARAS